jgi:hypothetical protein
MPCMASWRNRKGARPYHNLIQAGLIAVVAADPEASLLLADRWGLFPFKHRASLPARAPRGSIYLRSLDISCRPKEWFLIGTFHDL